MLRTVAITALALACTTACGVPASDTSAISKIGKYGSAEELMEAVVEAGYECPDWEETKPSLAPGVGLSSSSGTCGTKDQFLVYAGEHSVADQLDSWEHSFGQIPPSRHTLIGKNWIWQFETDANTKKLAKTLDARIQD